MAESASISQFLDDVLSIQLTGVVFLKGLDYSKDPFHQHVFLEHHLEPWCPSVGPVRFQKTLYFLYTRGFWARCAPSD
jgi:hypothetical protein